MSMMKQYFDAEIAAKPQQEYQTQGPDFAGYFEQAFREIDILTLELTSEVRRG